MLTKPITVAWLAAFLCVPAQPALKTIDNPLGGKIVYGQIPGQTTEAGAMAAMLRMLHSQYGARPQVGKLFQARGTQSVAAFFSVSKGAQGSGSALAGMIIATKAATDHVEAAVIYDDASHFGASYNPLMKTLLGVWRPLATAGGTSSPGVTGPVAPLHKFVTADRTASIDLPDGWNADPKSGSGSLLAQGPNGEAAFLGFTLIASDLNNPRARQTYETVRRGGLRGTSYANGIYYPLGPDLGKTFVDLLQLYRGKQNLPPALFQISSERPVQGPPGHHCGQFAGEIDAKDGKGWKEMNAVFCTGPEGPASGAFLAIADYTVVPKVVADRERATVAAVFASFQVDQAAVQRQANAYAAPAIEAIHQIGRNAAAQAAAAHQRNEIQNSSVYKHWDDMDKRSKEFSNYQLGYSVVRDRDNEYHGTFWNADADALVRSNPDRFEYVSAPDYWKGVDY